MISYRTFRNADPPAIFRIWKSQRDVPGLIAPVALQTIDRLILSKPYFDPTGFWLALDADWPIAFAHATLAGTAGAEPTGSVSMLQCFAPPPSATASAEPAIAEMVAPELIARCESYLRDRGCGVAFAGPQAPVDPYYFGLYGGATPGIPVSDRQRIGWFEGRGFQEAGRYQTRQCALSTFRAPVDRRQMQLKRELPVTIEYDWPAAGTWDACTRGALDRIRFRTAVRAGEPEAQLILLDLNALSGLFSPRIYAVESILATAEQWNSGVTAYLIAESVRQLQGYGVSSVVAHCAADAQSERQIWDRLSFLSVDESVVMQKCL